MAKSLKMFRRPFLQGATGLSAAALIGARGHAQEAQSLIARTEMAVQVIDFGWRREAFSFDTGGPAGAVTNEVHTLESAATHVRFRFQNGLSQSWTIAGASYAPTALAQSNPVDANGQAVSLAPVTFGNAGQDVALADQRIAASPLTSLTLPAAAQGGAFDNGGYLFRAIPNIVFSDWMPITAMPRGDGGPGALVSLRVWTPSPEFTGIRPKRINGNPPFQGTDARPWRAFFLPLDAAAGDMLTAPMDDPPPEQFANALCCGVQWIGQVAGLTLLSVGDSALMGGGEAQGYLGSIRRAADQMSTSALPVSHVSSAIYGCPSGPFIAAGRLAVQTNKISCAFIQTLSGNDPHTMAAAQQSLALAVALADDCQNNGALGVLVSPGPSRPTEDPGKAAIRSATMASLRDLQARGYHVLDLIAILSEGGSDQDDAAMRDGLIADDNRHLNSAGDTAVANGAIALLRSLPLTQG